MKKTTTYLISMLLLGGSAMNANIFTVGIYDPIGTANRVDNDIVTPGTIITAQPAGAVGVAEFTTNVASAFANNRGGVIDFESGAIGQAVLLGVDHSLGLGLTFGGQFNEFTNNTGNGRLPISGMHRLNGDRRGTIEFGSFFDVATSTPLTGYNVTQVGFTLLARQDRVWNGTVTATFSDASTASYTIAGLGNYGTPENALNPPEDTFLSFTAPAGLGITMIDFVHADGSGQFSLTIDDLGIIAIPEPSTYAAIFGLLVLGFVAVRRRLRK